MFALTANDRVVCTGSGIIRDDFFLDSSWALVGRVKDFSWQRIMRLLIVLQDIYQSLSQNHKGHSQVTGGGTRGMQARRFLLMERKVTASQRLFCPLGLICLDTDCLAGHFLSYLLLSKHVTVLFRGVKWKQSCWVNEWMKEWLEEGKLLILGGHQQCCDVLQVTTNGRASYYVSYQREPFIRIKLPKYSLPKVSYPFQTIRHNSDIMIPSDFHIFSWFYV